MSKTNKPIGIIAAMDIEVDFLLENMSDKATQTISGMTFTRGNLAERDAVVAVCGIGKCAAAMCAQTMILRYEVDAIINTGVAGALCDKLDIYDIAVATSAVQHDVDTTAIGDPVGLISGINLVNIPCCPDLAARVLACAKELDITAHSGVIATGDMFVSDMDKRAHIRATFDAIACEMEGGAIAQVCHVNRVKCTIIRSISDKADGHSEEYSKFKHRAAERSGRLVLRTLSLESEECRVQGAEWS
ncbi:MAG: 5'-methylthioadenosine/adenosylhomocysteine nucleosidase [Oscillospiraceae bacterium]|nr:5'-methylthioadenosine/adenosylhomocysteine nucleosidase [Oscillospiraceae bacterium]